MAFEAPTQLQLGARRLKGKKRLPKPIAARAPIPLERDYIRQLMPYLQSISFYVRTQLITRLPSLAAEFDAYRGKKRDAAPDDIDRIIRNIWNAIDTQWSAAAIARIAAAKGIEVNRYNRTVIANNIRKVIGIDVFMPDDMIANELALFTVNNTSLIKSIADESLRRVETMVYQGLSDGTRVETLAKEVQQYVDPDVGNTRSRANLIARDQISKLNANLTETRQTDLGIRRYVWRTVGDERVRDSHREKEGKKFSWDDPPADTGHPGEDYQCRCYAEPVLEDLVPGMVVDDE